MRLTTQLFFFVLICMFCDASKVGNEFMEQTLAGLGSWLNIPTNHGPRAQWRARKGEKEKEERVGEQLE